MNGRRFARVPSVLLLLAALTMGAGAALPAAGAAPPGFGAAPVCSPWGGAASFSAWGEPDEAGFYLVKEEAEATYTFAGLPPGATDIYLQLELRATEGASVQVWFGEEERPFIFALNLPEADGAVHGHIYLSPARVNADGKAMVRLRAPAGSQFRVGACSVRTVQVPEAPMPAAAFLSDGQVQDGWQWLGQQGSEARWEFRGIRMPHTLIPQPLLLRLSLRPRGNMGVPVRVTVAPGAGQPGRTALLWFNPAPYTADGFLALSTADIGTDGTVFVTMRPAWDPLPTASAGVVAESAVLLLSGSHTAFRGPTPGETAPGITLLTMRAGHPLVYRNREPVMLDVAPFITEGRTMLPFRFLAESLGAEVEWDEAAQGVTFWRERMSVQLVIGSREARAGQRTVTLDVPPMLRDGRTFVPVRFIAQTLGAQVDYLPESGQIEVRAPAGNP